jgi:hypothetical protein
LKNELAIENFSGKTETSVRQDFYAAMYLSNLSSAFYWEAQEKVEEEQKGRNNKYEYQVNMNHEFGVLKDELVRALLEDDDDKRSLLFDDIAAKIKYRIEPVRPNRSVPRKPPRKQRFYMNKKRNC